MDKAGVVADPGGGVNAQGALLQGYPLRDDNGFLVGGEQKTMGIRCGQAECPQKMVVVGLRRGYIGAALPGLSR